MYPSPAGNVQVLKKHFENIPNTLSLSSNSLPKKPNHDIIPLSSSDPTSTRFKKAFEFTIQQEKDANLTKNIIIEQKELKNILTQNDPTLYLDSLNAEKYNLNLRCALASHIFLKEIYSKNKNFVLGVIKATLHILKELFPQHLQVLKEEELRAITYPTLYTKEPTAFDLIWRLYNKEVFTLLITHYQDIDFSFFHNKYIKSYWSRKESINIVQDMIGFVFEHDYNGYKEARQKVLSTKNMPAALKHGFELFDRAMLAHIFHIQKKPDSLDALESFRAKFWAHFALECIENSKISDKTNPIYRSVHSNLSRLTLALKKNKELSSNNNETLIVAFDARNPGNHEYGLLYHPNEGVIVVGSGGYKDAYTAIFNNENQDRKQTTLAFIKSIEDDNFSCLKLKDFKDQFMAKIGIYINGDYLQVSSNKHTQSAGNCTFLAIRNLIRCTCATTYLDEKKKPWNHSNLQEAFDETKPEQKTIDGILKDAIIKYYKEHGALCNGYILNMAQTIQKESKNNKTYPRGQRFA